MNVWDEHATDNRCFVSINYSKALNQKRLINPTLLWIFTFNHTFMLFLNPRHFNSKIKYFYTWHKKADKINKFCDEKVEYVLCKQVKSLNADWDGNMLCRRIVKKSDSLVQIMRRFEQFFSSVIAWNSAGKYYFSPPDVTSWKKIFQINISKTAVSRERRRQ